ncbi:hypothetical protein HBI95_186120 [Parastagonospora nodorum]|nr:hypothetical protein HBH50_203440 [Parastagonospora nodorum]KAH4081005.1 hypothetical protein HBH48_199080 [Parastagonospora nodorum]KAH4197065.1 hypothetical protein HBI95_186120 [Parastagonospora nodorum]KAH4530620.1 hypothetical protein HBH85_188350 [Parastagonospora nodorum]KAH4842431.1 hypothetical protein HBH75_213300 [Parastagonospora nodorum]
MSCRRAVRGFARLSCRGGFDEGEDEEEVEVEVFAAGFALRWGEFDPFDAAFAILWIGGAAQVVIEAFGGEDEFAAEQLREEVYLMKRCMVILR